MHLAGMFCRLFTPHPSLLASLCRFLLFPSLAPFRYFLFFHDNHSFLDLTCLCFVRCSPKANTHLLFLTLLAYTYFYKYVVPLLFDTSMVYSPISLISQISLVYVDRDSIIPSCYSLINKFTQFNLLQPTCVVLKTRGLIHLSQRFLQHPSLDTRV